MGLNIDQEVKALHQMSIAELQAKYREVYCEEPRSRNRQFLLRRVAWRLQVLEEGDLTERARRRARELANDADLRVRPPKDVLSRDDAPDPSRTVTATFPERGDGRLPMPGAQLTREYRGRKVVVTVLTKGFEWDGRVYKSLSAVAKAVTGSHWNGYDFFGLRTKAAN
jgi:hypothetical protein